MNSIPISGGLSAALVFGAVASSLIPALVIKVLMSVFFQRSVGFLKVLIAIIASVFLAFGVAYALGLQSEAAFRALPQNTTLMITGASMLAQAVLLTVIVTDEIGQRIPLWQWIIVLILQYVLYIGFAFLLALALSV